jgi:hypothetical protein
VLIGEDRANDGGEDMPVECAGLGRLQMTGKDADEICGDGKMET